MVCKESVERLIASLQAHSSGFIAALSSGEGWKLTDEQWRDMVVYTKTYSGAKPVLAGLMRPTTDEVIMRAKLAEELEVDAIVVTTPFGEAVEQDEILKHYQRVAEFTSLPIFIYNESAVSKNKTSLEVLLQVAAMDAVVGIKESSGSLDMTRALVEAEVDLAVFQGWEDLSYESVGVDGYVMALANLEAGMCLEMFENPTPEQQDKMISFCKENGLFEKDWYSYLKKHLKARGIIQNDRVIS